MRDDPEDPERDVASRLEEMKSRESIQLLLNNDMFALFVMFTNPTLLLGASKGYWVFPHKDKPFIFVYFLDVIDCRSVQAGVFTLHIMPRGVSSILDYAHVMSAVRFNMSVKLQLEIGYRNEIDI